MDDNVGETDYLVCHQVVLFDVANDLRLNQKGKIGSPIEKTYIDITQMTDLYTELQYNIKYIINLIPFLSL